MSDLLAGLQQRTLAALDTRLSLDGVPDRLRQAIRYSVFNGGKRIRPCLVYLASQVLDGDLARADNAACAIELLHCYSLIHDDLPCMDDDDLRRGNPTLHIQFDEATAVLAGDAMQSLAFGLLADDEQLPADVRLKLVSLYARAAGANGMVAGQVIDLGAETTAISTDELRNMHQRKTGDLICACLQAAALINDADTAVHEAFTRYGYALGLAFQVRDDILDETADTATLGKPQGSDSGNEKTTFVSTYGLAGAEAQLQQLHEQALAALAPLGSSAAPLVALTDYLTVRSH